MPKKMNKGTVSPGVFTALTELGVCSGVYAANNQAKATYQVPTP